MRESYCGLCDQCPLGSQDFLESLAKVKNHVNQLPVYWWTHCFPGVEGFSFPEFFKGLEWFLSNTNCAGCKKGGGLEQCPLRDCARQRQVAQCSECPDVDTCEIYESITQGYPGRRIYLHRDYIKLMS